MAGLKDEVLEPKGIVQVVNPVGSTFLTVPAGARIALINITGTGPLIFSDDGTDASGTHGISLPTGTNLWYTGKVTKLKFSGTGTLNIAYYA